MSPQLKQVVGEQPVEVVQVRVLSWVEVLGLVVYPPYEWLQVGPDSVEQSVANRVSSSWSPIDSVGEKSSLPSSSLPPLPSCSRALT